MMVTMLTSQTGQSISRAPPTNDHEKDRFASVDTESASRNETFFLEHSNNTCLPTSDLSPCVEEEWEHSILNPYNWRLSKRIYHTVVISLLGLNVTFSSSIYTPAIPQIMENFQVSEIVALLPFTLFVLGLGFGPVLAAPLSERFGRTATYFISMPLFALFTLGTGLSQTFGSVLVCRLLAGIFGSPPLVVAVGTVADLWKPESRAATTSFVVLFPYVGPAMGPLVGGFASPKMGWRWTQWITIIFVVTTYMLALGMKETYKKTILQRHAKFRGFQIAPIGPTGLVALKVMFFVTFLRPIHMLFTEPIVIAWSILIAFNFGIVYSFLAAFPFVYTTVYGFNLQQIGLIFISLAIGSVFGCITIILIDRLWYQKLHALRFTSWSSGLVPPEHRLHASLLGSILSPLGLFWFAWTARHDIHWISSTSAVVLIAWANLCIFMSGMMYLVDVYEALTAASAVAATALLRYILAAVFPLFINPVYTRLGVGWATSAFAFFAVALMPIPWVLFKWGPNLRSISRYNKNST